MQRYSLLTKGLSCFYFNSVAAQPSLTMCCIILQFFLFPIKIPVPVIETDLTPFSLYYRAFCDKLNKARLDHLFSLLFDKTLAKPPGETEKRSCVSKLSDLMPGVQWLNLPLSTEVCEGFIFSCNILPACIMTACYFYQIFIFRALSFSCRL